MAKKLSKVFGKENIKLVREKGEKDEQRWLHKTY